MAMNEDHLSEIEARASAASNGPWKPFDAGNPDGGPDGKLKTWVWKDNGNPWYNAVCECNCDDSGSSEQEMADARFIAAARTDIPDLIAEIRRLKELVK